MVKYLIGNVKGEDGISPSAKVEQRGNAATITITDASGTTTATIVGGGGGGSYAAGDGIDITNNVISVDNTIATKDEIPTELSELTNDVGFITEETEPEFNASAAATITAEDIQEWDSKSDFSGDYEDLTNKPDLSEFATTDNLDDKQDKLTAGANITIENNVISATGGGGGTTYTAGEGINISGTEISVDEQVVALKSELFSGDYNDLTNKPTIPTVPTNVSAFTNDAGYITSYTETDPVFTASPSHSITASDISSWNNKQDELTAGTGISIQNNVISATGGGGSSYTAGDNIDITNDVISVVSPIELSDSDASYDYSVSVGGNEIEITSESDGNLEGKTQVQSGYIVVENGGRDNVQVGADGISLNEGRIGNSMTINTDGIDLYNAQEDTQAIIGWSSSANLGISYDGGTTFDDIAMGVIPTADGTTIIDNNGVWSAVGGGGSSTTRVIKVDTWDRNLDILTLPTDDLRWLIALCNGDKDKSNCVLAIGTAEIEYFIPTKWYTFYGSEATPHTHKRVVFSSMRKDERKECYLEADEDHSTSSTITLTTYITGEITLAREPRVITYQSSISNYSADDKEYIENCFANGIQNYPFVLIYTSGNNTYRFEPQGIQPFTNALVCFSWGNATGSGLVYSFQSQTFTFTFSNGTLNNQFLSGYGINASGVVSREARDNPSGQSNSTIDSELNYIKNNYATKLGWNIPKYEITSWTFSNWSTTVVNWLKAIRDEGYENHPGILWYTGLNNTDNDYWLFSGNGNDNNRASGGIPCPQLIFARYTNFGYSSSGNFAYNTDFYGPHVLAITMYPETTQGIVAVNNMLFPPIPDRTVITNSLKSPSGLAQSLDLELEYIKDNYSYPTIASGDAGKVLAVNSGETGVEWATAGGGSSYTAGRGIDIDANDTISTVSNNPLIHSMLLMTTSGNQNNMPNVVSLGASSTWDDFVNNIKQGKVVYITTSTSYTFSESYKLTPALFGITTLYAMNLDALSIASMGASVSAYPSTGTQVYFTTFYYFDGAFLWSWKKPEQLGNYIKVHYKNYNNYALGKALQDINTDIAAKQDVLNFGTGFEVNSSTNDVDIDGLSSDYPADAFYIQNHDGMGTGPSYLTTNTDEQLVFGKENTYEHRVITEDNCGASVILNAAGQLDVAFTQEYTPANELYMCDTATGATYKLEITNGELVLTNMSE